mgnify:FL=1
MPALNPLGLALLTVGVSASGVLSPGPLSVSAVAFGARGSWASGLKEALGHMTFELPYVVAIGVALAELRGPLSGGPARLALGAAMAAFITFFSAETIRDGASAIRRGSALDPSRGNASGNGPYVTGLALTALNPFFLLWWLTVGLVLVRAAGELGLVRGLAIMYPAHVWMDFAWLTALAAVGQGGRMALGRWYGALLIVLAVLMFVSGLYALGALLLSA